MPRTIEHILACHSAAEELRAAGKPIWKGTVNIKGLVGADRGNVSAEYISQLSRRIASVLRAKLPSRYFDISSDDYDFDFVDVVEMMEACTEAELADDLKHGFEAVVMFDDWLMQIYDFADRNRIWMGP
jgi:hypothetical protein